MGKGKKLFGYLGIIVLSCLIITGCDSVSVTYANITHLDIYTDDDDGLLFHTDTTLPLQLHAVATHPDCSQQDVSSQSKWSSSNAAVALVDAAGKVTQVGRGTATITASLNGFNNSYNVTVLNFPPESIAILSDNNALFPGVTDKLSAIGFYSDGSSHDITNEVTWSSGSDSIISTDSSLGVITANGIGTTTIKAGFGSVTAGINMTVTANNLASIKINAVNATLHKGFHSQLSATGVFQDGSSQDLTKSVTWASSDETIAVISNQVDSNGLLHAGSVGAVTVSVSIDQFTGNSTFTVDDAEIKTVFISGPDSVTQNTYTQLSATAIFTDEKEQDISNDVMWLSADSNIATINQTGRVRGANIGNAEITVSTGCIRTTHSITVDNSPKVTYVTNTVEFRAALLAAVDNGQDDKIYLADGSYKVMDDGVGTFYYVGTSLEKLILEGTARDKVILDGENTRRVLYFDNLNGSVSLSNMTIQNGIPLFDGITFSEDGGGVYSNARALDIENSKIIHNSASFGAGIYTRGSGRSITVKDTLIEGNTGVGLDIEAGCGIYIWSNSPGTIVVHNSQFINNECGLHAYNTPTEIYDSLFTGNYGANSALNTSNGSGAHKIVNSIFYGNLVLSPNPSPFNAVSIITSKSIEIINTIFANNEGGVRGEVYSPSNFKIINTSFWNNNGLDLSTRDVIFESSFIDLNNVDGLYIEKDTVYSLTPNFKDEAAGDYHLTETSIMVDAGLNLHPDSEIPKVDFEGNTRPIGTSTDIGPYEFNPTAP